MQRKIGCLIVVYVLAVGLDLVRRNGANSFVGHIFGGGSMCVIAAMFAWIGIAGIIGRLQLLRNGLRIRGNVVDKRIGSEGMNPIVEYKGQNGEIRRKEVCFVRPNTWHVGDEIDLLYDPESEYIEPEKNKYEGWGFLIMSAVMGTIGIWAGLSWLIRGG